MSKISFEVVKIHIEVHLQTFHRQRTRVGMARRCKIWDRFNFPNAAAWVNKMGNLLFNLFFSRKVWSVAWQCLFYEPFSGGHYIVMWWDSIVWSLFMKTRLNNQSDKGPKRRVLFSKHITIWSNLSFKTLNKLQHQNLD